MYVPNQKINCFITFLYGYSQHLKQKRSGIFYSMSKILLVDLGLLLVILKEILHPHEKIRRNLWNTSRMHDFVDFIDSCHLLELQSFGLPFTWFNKRDGSDSIFEKLDRVLINE